MEEQVEHLAAPPSNGAAAILALIERVALDPGADAAKLERIVAMYERVKAKEAGLAFNAAKGRILKKLAGIKFGRTGPPSTRSRRESLRKGRMKPLNTSRWRRSTNTCARSCWRRRWISPIPTNRASTAGS
jgi:hypothetical protein